MWERGVPVRDEIMQINLLAEGGVDKITTVRRVNVPWKERELDDVISAIKALRPAEEPKWRRLIAMLEKTKEMTQGARMLPGGMRWTPMDFRHSDVMNLLEVLIEAKTGKKKQTLDEQMAEARKKGGGLWKTHEKATEGR